MGGGYKMSRSILNREGLALAFSYPGIEWPGVGVPGGGVILACSR